MLIQYQRFQFGGRVQEIEVETNPLTGKQYVLLRDVQDVFPTASRFEREGRPIKFLSDEQGHRLDPWRIAHHPESILHIIPGRVQQVETPLAMTMPVDLAGVNSPHSPPYDRNSPSKLLAPRPFVESEENWQDYLLQRSVRMVILVLISSMTLLMNQEVSSWLWSSTPFPMVAMYWSVVTMTLFLLSVVWFLMLVFQIMEVVLFLVRIPIVTKRSTYQRLFDF